MTNLDSLDEIRQLDKENVLGSVEALPEQIEQAWEEVKQVEVPEDYRQIKNIVVSGMGGSALGARVIQSLYKEELKYPLEVVNHYALPGYVNSESLVVLSSYSGTTEETLASAEDAGKRGAKMVVISAGGELLKLAQDNGYPYFKLDPKFNPSNQPRMAIGSSVMAQLGLFNQLGVITVNDEDVKEIVTFLRKRQEELTVAPQLFGTMEPAGAGNLANGLEPSQGLGGNLAKRLARLCQGKLVFIMSAEHLAGAAHVMNNQVNENAKHMTSELLIPELNHHYLEGLPYPKEVKGKVVFLLFNSLLYHERVQRRFSLTQEVIVKNELEAEMVTMQTGTKALQVWELIQLGAYTNFYLAMLDGVNPAPIPWVDWFKEQLKKS